MGVTIDEHIVKQFTDGILHTPQQQGSKLEKAVMVKSGVVGESVSFNFLDTVDLKQRTTRHEATPRTSPDHSRRWATLTFWEQAILLDPADKLQVLTDPTSDYLQALRMAAGRRKDKLILEAALGTVKTGKKGSGTSAFSSDYTIEHGSAGMSVDKLRAIKKKLGANDVDPDLPVNVALTTNQVDDLLGEIKVTSADYNHVKTLHEGKVAYFMGCNLIPVSTSIVAVSSNIRDCVAWAKGGLGLAIGQDIKTRISEEGDVSYAIQAYLGMFLGSARVVDKKVLKVQCQES